MRLVLFAVLLIAVQVVSAAKLGNQVGQGTVGGGQHGKPTTSAPRGK
jgi:hypothetical protein